MKNRSLKFRLIWFITSIIILMAMLNVYSIFTSKTIETQYKEMINNMYNINQIGTDINLSVSYFDNYMSSKTQSNLDYYNKYLFDARDKIEVLKGSMDEKSLVVLNNIENTINSYSEKANDTYNKFLLSGKFDEFYPSFTETKMIASYIDDYVRQLNDNYLKYNKSVYQELKANTRKSGKLIIGLFIFITFMCMAFAFAFSKEITMPLNELVEASQKVSKGDFEIENFNSSDIYEINVLYNGFNIMVGDIKKLIVEMKEKANIEKKLKDQEMENLKIENMLKEAKFKSLQSQVNPHFLFNTLNAIAQTSEIEGAYETERLIDSVSDILRYSLSMVDRTSTIGQEIEMVKQYMYIQETRFKDRIGFNLNVDSKLLNVEMPGMTLQPLVENSFIHGIDPKEDGGSISINAYRDLGYCIVEVIDDGMGMSQERIDEILNNKDVHEHHGHTTGIGVINVVNRLKLLYDYDDVLTIKSAENKGTKVSIKIRLNEGVNYA
ncbi:MAG TPA: sensor histidine kinase [Clostridiaceae bacterium]|nr:sensor histidine kinase [Clostridiaceae bacterium]HBG38853.1 sensor histidine kinase [Clostridiaceae bacterium]HBN27573.1 sensor histidine kinase [Clostridiaceae bacterium]HBX48149.1 sensor histidine kinase [Clostridiaceae bacterium]HCL50273.1 sensor histidine kinase [Clostridiaceae bacterium]